MKVYDPNKGQKDFTKERRQFPRVNEATTIFYNIKSGRAVLQYGRENYNAIAVDISEGGVGLITAYDLQEHTTIFMRFILFGETSKSIETDGEVKYIVFNIKEKAYRIGVQFIGLAKESKEFIRALVKQKLLFT